MGEIIFEDEAVRAIWHSASDNRLVVTFGDSMDLADGVRFFADVPLKKSAMTALGIMAKQPNWYPPASVQRVRVLVEALITRRSSRTMYGGSMGGYAAIKFSRLFQATEIIALCPQWTIDPNECAGWEPGWAHHFRPAMAGMSVSPSDVSGKVFVFVDPGCELDMRHFLSIKRASLEAEMIAVPGARV